MAFVYSALDVIPVIGTIKEGVEAVAALCHVDFKTAGEQGLQAVVGGVLDATTFGVGGIVEKLVVKGAIEGTEKAIAKQVITKAEQKALIGGTTQMTVADIMKMPRMLIKKDPADTVTKKPSTRGEHVINNNVQKIIKQIVEQFLFEEGYNYREVVLQPEMTVFKACETPLPEPIRTAIMTELVARINAEEQAYIDANATLYGIHKQFLLSAIVVYMRAAFGVLERGADASVLPGLERGIIERVEIIIANDLFVDQHALVIWLQQGGTTRRYETVKDEVVRMFRRLEYHNGNNEVLLWVRDLIRAIHTFNGVTP